MKARTSILFLALTMALVACNRSGSDTLGSQATAPSPTDTDLPAVANSASELDIPLDEDELAARADEVSFEVATEPVETDVETEPTPPALVASFTLRHGETLHHFARWSGLTVEAVAEASELDLSGHYQVGDTVRIPLDDPEQRGVIESSREAHHTKRAEGYLASRGGAIGAEFVTVATGDSATTIARQQAGIPIWLLQTYNPAVDLERLRPGQELMVPILADIVADAGDVEPANQAPSSD